MKHVLKNTGWAVMHKEDTEAKAIFRGVEAAADYARILNDHYKTEKWSVYPWTIDADLFSCD